MRPIDNAHTCQGSQRAREKCQQLMGGALALSLSPSIRGMGVYGTLEGSSTAVPSMFIYLAFRRACLASTLLNCFHHA
jgi:hypothetical protein